MGRGQAADRIKNKEQGEKARNYLTGWATQSALFGVWDWLAGEPAFPLKDSIGRDANVI